MSALVGKRLVLIGCGTIGSHLAKFLVQTGAGHRDGALMLVDKDTLTPGNIGRHLLGLDHLGQNKAQAIATVLRQEFPTSNIQGRASNALKLLRLFEGVDLVIDASGEEPLSRAINEHFLRCRSRGSGPDVLHVWLAGAGDAAQALLVDSLKYGCYQCLRAGADGPWRYWPLLDEHSPHPVMGPCGEGMFMPYGVGAPAIAAGLALQVAVDWAAKRVGPRLRTMPINSRTTRRLKDINLTKRDDCPACSPIAAVGEAARPHESSSLPVS
jgi:hypothetical protein